METVIDDLQASFSERASYAIPYREVTAKEEVHRTSPLQGWLPAFLADRLRVLTRHRVIPQGMLIRRRGF
jgi:hypothetical protein